MNNNTYRNDNVTPLEELLLRRLEATEATLGQLMKELTTQLPSTNTQVSAIVQQSQQSQAVAVELSACRMLQQLTGETHMSPAESYTTGQAQVQFVYESLAAIFSFENGQPHPLGLEPSAIMAGMGDLTPLEDGAPLAWSHVDDLLTRVKDHTRAYVFTALTGQPAPTLVASLTGTLEQYLVVVPEACQWFIMSVDREHEHYFLHHQAQFVDWSRNSIDAIILPTLTDEVKPFFSEEPDTIIDVTLATTIASIFSYLDGQVDLKVSKEGLYTFEVGTGNHEPLGKVVAIHRQASPFQVLIAQSHPNALLIRNGEQAKIVKFEEASVLVKNLLLMTMYALLVKVKPSKAKPALPSA